MRFFHIRPYAPLLIAALLACPTAAIAVERIADPGTPGGESAPAPVATPSNFGAPLVIGLDVQPGDPDNRVTLGAGDGVAVALLAGPEFDPTGVDPASLRLRGIAPMRGSQGRTMAVLLDVNEDGAPDLVVHFPPDGLESPGIQLLVLTGALTDGRDLAGEGLVEVVRPDGPEGLDLGGARLHRDERGTVALRAPSPVRGAVSAEFALAGVAPAQLELLDVTGRRLAVRALAGRARGGVRFEESSQAPPGVYFVRLRQGAMQSIVRVTRLR